MNNTLFIASRMRYKRPVVTVSIAVSYIVMIVAMAISSGFRSEVREALSQMGGDVQLVPSNMNYMEESKPVRIAEPFIEQLKAVGGVESVEPAIYKAGIVKAGDDIHGIVVKGVSSDDTTALSVSIPRKLSAAAGLGVGDKMLTYFVGEKIKARNFKVASVYDPVVEANDQLIVYASIADLRRLNGWSEDEASMMEIRMKPDYRDEESINYATQEIGFIAYSNSSETENSLYASSTLSRYPQLFDWLDLLDFNVLFVLVLMMIVAGFNMISGLLITLFENISTIGVFKAMGMTNRAISKVFLTSSAALVLKGMLIGNLLAGIFCFVQDKFHLLKLNPTNYFVSFVPVNVSVPGILALDLVSFAVIMTLLLIPCAFILRVDPADTVRVR